jgi:hypothetical protein
VPGKETVFSGETRNGEDLHRLAGEEWCQRCGGDSRIAQGQRGESNGLTLVIAQRAVRANELTNPMSAGKAFV